MTCNREIALSSRTDASVGSICTDCLNPLEDGRGSEDPSSPRCLSCQAAFELREVFRRDKARVAIKQYGCHLDTDRVLVMEPLFGSPEVRYAIVYETPTPNMATVCRNGEILDRGDLLHAVALGGPVGVWLRELHNVTPSLHFHSGYKSGRLFFDA